MPLSLEYQSNLELDIFLNFSKAELDRKHFFLELFFSLFLFVPVFEIHFFSENKK